MASAWIESKPKSDEFEAFLELYKAYLDGKTAEPIRLLTKISKVWQNFDMAKKKDFTDRLVLTGILGERNNNGIEVFGGTITEFF
jgi:hypothetical protein